MTKIIAEYQGYQRSRLMKELAVAAHRKEYRGQTSSATYPEVEARIKMMSLSPDSRILDAGCGNGAFGLQLAAEFPFFIDGIDLSEELIKEAIKLASQENLSDRCRFSVRDFTNFSTYPTDIFNAVICIGSLYWGQPLSTILDIWRRATHSGGQLLLFLNLEYTSLNSDEKEAIGETQFLSALTVEYELSQHGWALCEWTNATASYI